MMGHKHKLRSDPPHPSRETLGMGYAIDIINAMQDYFDGVGVADPPTEEGGKVRMVLTNAFGNEFVITVEPGEG